MIGAQRGFTLIELMIAISLLAVITGIVYVAFAAVTDSTQAVRESVVDLRQRMFLVRSFKTNFTTAFAKWSDDPTVALDGAAGAGQYQSVEDVSEDVTRELGFVGVDGEGPHGPADSVTFFSTASAATAVQLPGDLKQVTYELGERRDLMSSGDARADMDEVGDKNDTVLVIRELPLLAGGEKTIDPESSGFRIELDPTSGQEAQAPEPVGIAVATLDITYFDGEDWVDEWDSAEMGRLPWSVRIRVNFPKTDEQLELEAGMGIDSDAEADLDLTIPIPVGMGYLQDKRELQILRNMSAAAGNPDSQGAPAEGGPKRGF